MLHGHRNPKENIFLSPGRKNKAQKPPVKESKPTTPAKVEGAVYEYVFNKDGTYGFRFLSPDIEKMFGITVSKFMKSFDHIHPDDKERLTLANKHSEQTNEPFYFEGRLITPGGDVKWHSAASSLTTITKTGSRVFTGIILDITERKLAEQEALKERDLAVQQKKKEILHAVLEAHERERQELADELHENISQSLSSCKLLLSATLKKDSPRNEIMEQVLSHIDKAINELRNISYSLSSSALQLIGLPQALTDLISRVTPARKIGIYLDANKFRILKDYDPKIYLTIYRLVQEQLLNIVKHSDATQVNIILAVQKDKLSIEVHDNGHGFDKEKVPHGLGLTNIFNRVEHHNGTIEIDSQPGKGCRLKANIPYK